MERVATETTNCNRDLFFNVECGGETFPIAIYQKLDPILWRGEAWAATEYGIERLDGRCWLKVSDLAKGYRSGGRSLPEDIAEKGAEFEADFAAVWRKALDHHGFALIDTPEGEAWITRSLTKAAEIAQGAAARKAKGDAERERQEAEKEASRKAQQRFHIFNTWEFKDRPEPAWLVERVIRDKALTLIFGKSE